VERDVLRTKLRVPLQAFEDLVWCADEVKPVAVALLLRRKLLLVGRNQEGNIILTSNDPERSGDLHAVLA
jgi:hypothetical protein